VSGFSEYFRSKVSLFITDEIDKKYLISIQKKQTLNNDNAHKISFHDISQLKNWLSSSSFFSLFDTVWLPFLILIMYELHPYYGHLSVILVFIYVFTAIGEYILTSHITLENQKTLQKNNRETHNFILHHELLTTSGFYSQYFESWKQKFMLSNIDIRNNLKTVDFIRENRGFSVKKTVK
jgi:ABC-type protease/lipase transport system fused ATPase/permease subunit